MKKNHFVTGIAILAIIIALVAVFRAPGDVISDETTFDKILREDKIKACYVPWPPSTIKDPNTGEISGFMTELFMEIAKDANLEVEFIESTWGGFSADVSTGKCDVAAAGVYPMIGRSTTVSFTEPFFFSGNSAVVKAGDDRFTSINDLNKKGVKIAVIEGEFGSIFARKHLPKAELLVLEKGADNTAPLIAVSSGQADVGLSMSDVIAGYVEEHPELDDLFPDQPYSTTPITWAVRKDDQQLLNFLNNGLNYLKSTGFLDATAKKHDPVGWFSLKQEYVALG